jgi:hypothetical protein|tara:strand:+ start:7399 stop:7524 length:126 start_codon:yes stop_codon:yes gene_type:complete
MKRTKKYRIIEEIPLIIANVVIFTIVMVVVIGCAILLVGGL